KKHFVPKVPLINSKSRLERPVSENEKPSEEKIIMEDISQGLDNVFSENTSISSNKSEFIRTRDDFI
ncbi:hypothetical protein AAMO2058_000254400, partial [Amorphochlora amoebiformis]